MITPAEHSSRLIPPSNNNFIAISHQIENIRGTVASAISKKYEVYVDGTIVRGNGIAGQASVSTDGNVLNLFLTEEMAAAEVPPYELLVLVAERLGVEDSNHRSLLYSVLVGSDIDSICSNFSQQGIEIGKSIFSKSSIYSNPHVSESNIGTADDTKPRYQAQRHLVPIPSSSWKNTTRSDETGSVNTDGLVSDHSQTLERSRVSREDRRLPIIQETQMSVSSMKRHQGAADLMSLEHIQHLGEHLVRSDPTPQLYIG